MTRSVAARSRSKRSRQTFHARARKEISRLLQAVNLLYRAFFGFKEALLPPLLWKCMAVAGIEAKGLRQSQNQSRKVKTECAAAAQKTIRARGRARPRGRAAQIPRNVSP